MCVWVGVVIVVVVVRDSYDMAERLIVAVLLRIRSCDGVISGCNGW